MIENKMSEVAKLFDKELGEEFTVKYKGECYKAYFKANGIKVRAMYHAFWDSVLIELLTGEAVIIDEKTDDFTE